jgi:hypothetical protein
MGVWAQAGAAQRVSATAAAADAAAAALAAPGAVLESFAPLLDLFIASHSIGEREMAAALGPLIGSAIFVRTMPRSIEVPQGVAGLTLDHTQIP